MPMRSTAPALPLFHFTLTEVHASAWACACADVVLRSGPSSDPQAREFRRLLPDLPGLLAALEGATLTRAHAHTLATVLASLLEVRAQLAPNVWAALQPPAGDVLEAAQSKACGLMGPSCLRLSVAQA